MLRRIIRRQLFSMPTFLLAALLLFVCTTSPALAQGEMVSHTILLDSYPPFYQWKNSKPSGPFVDITVEAFRRMGMEVEFQQSTWKRALFEVQSGGASGLCAGVKNPRREAFAIFPEEALGMDHNWVVTRADSMPGLRSLEDLNGRTVGVVEGYSFGADFDERDDFQRQASLTEELLLKQLLGGRVDIIVGSRKVIEYVASQIDAQRRLEFHFRIADSLLYLMLSRVRPESQALAQSFDETLQGMRKDGTISAIEAQYIH